MQEKPNQYRGFNGQTYSAPTLEIFMHPTLNGGEEWHVSGVESDSYSCYQGSPSSSTALTKAAEKVIRSKVDFIGEIHFSIRPIDPDFIGNGNYAERRSS